MKQWISSLCIPAIISTIALCGEYEGTATFRNYGRVDWNWMVQFLPYNPLIVEIGAYCGAEALQAARVWPRGKVIAFEPNLRAYGAMQSAIAEAKMDHIFAYPLAIGNANGFAKLHICRASEEKSSLLPPSDDMAIPLQGPEVEVPCVILDDWCQKNNIQEIDILKLSVEGFELQLLESSPNILKNVKLIVLQSFFYPYRKQMTNYFYLKDFLAKAHFLPLAHWYIPGGQGNAVYVSQEMFDAYFVRCLGLGLGGLLYP
jgi:FkbM family methyltransferase